MTERVEQPYMGERWYALLAAAVEADPRGRAGVAERISYSRGAVSNTLAGNYGAGVDGVARAVLDHYDRPACPLVGGEEIERDACRRKSLRPRPFGGVAILAQWEVCQACEHKPAGATPAHQE